MPQPYRHQRSQESVTDEKVDDVAVRNRQRQNTDQRQDHEEDSDGADRDAHGARKDRVPPQGMQQHHGDRHHAEDAAQVGHEEPHVGQDAGQSQVGWLSRNTSQPSR